MEFPGTNIAAERLFITAGDITTTQRSTLLSPPFTLEHTHQLLLKKKKLSSDVGQ